MNDMDFSMQCDAYVSALLDLARTLDEANLDYPTESDITTLASVRDQVLEIGASIGRFHHRVELRRSKDRQYKHGRRVIGHRMIGGSVPIVIDCDGSCDLNGGTCTCGESNHYVD